MKPLLCASLLLLIGCEPAEPKVLLEPEREVTAEALYAAYSSNEIAAERDYGSTPIRVTGTVILVAQGGIVMLRTSAGPQVGLAMLDGFDDALAGLRPGDTFTADCQETIYYQGLVSPRDCRPSSSPSA